MKILFISTIRTSPWGGSEELWYNLLLLGVQLDKDKRIKYYTCTKFWKKVPKKLIYLNKIGVKTFYRDDRSIFNKIIRRLNSILKVSLPNLAQLRIMLLKPDFILLSQGAYFECLDWVQFFNKIGIKYSIITQAASESWWVDDRTRIKLREGFIKAQNVFFVSNANLNLVAEQLSVDFINSEILYNPTKIDYDLALDFPSLENDKFILAIVARLESNAKGQDLVLRLMEMEKWRARNLKIIFYGKGPNKQLYKEWISRKNIKNVELRDYVSDVEEIWKRCHGLLLPSRHEGMPLSIIEAMFCSRIAIATKVAGNVEIIQDNRNGFLASAPTVELLDEALEKAWKNRLRWKEMGLIANNDIKEVIKRNNIEISFKKVFKAFDFNNY